MAFRRPPSEAVPLKRIAAGDPDVFSELYRRHLDGVVSFTGVHRGFGALTAGSHRARPAHRDQHQRAQGSSRPTPQLTDQRDEAAQTHLARSQSGGSL